MNGFKEKLKPLVEEYEEKFGPLKKSMTSTNMWSWIKDRGRGKTRRIADVCL